MPEPIVAVRITQRRGEVAVAELAAAAVEAREVVAVAAAVAGATDGKIPVPGLDAQGSQQGGSQMTRFPKFSRKPSLNDTAAVLPCLVVLVVLCALSPFGSRAQAANEKTFS